MQTIPATLPDYEIRLDENARWALSEGSRHFDEKSAVHETLRNICRRLGELKIPYAVVGGMAMFRHGLRRFTEDVDLLVTKDGLRKIHENLSGLGYTHLFAGSKNLRDTETRVRVEFLQTGTFPGSGEAQPVRFPHPTGVSEEHDGIRFVNLLTLVELKLASGMTGQDRMKDLADVQELIKLLSLPEDFGDNLNPYVQPKYSEIWKSAAMTSHRFIRLWRNKFLTIDAKSIDEMIDQLDDATAILKKMRDDGVTLDASGGTGDDYSHLVTEDADVAKKYDMHDEREFLDLDEDEADATEDGNE
ncbi:MAG: nucleotidyl transferase AbiEii/AbiGii toxin family protein [Planctomycetes bacterium]|nr:nucleotidyl transferase AbiEii/AbiGii toxin family protein [Planctomycetota bacterium]